MKDDVKRLFDAARANCWKERSVEVAELLGESEQTLTNWKKRGIPKDKLLEVAERVRVNPYWLRDGDPVPMDPPYPMEKDIVDLLKVAEMLPHEYRQHLTEQGTLFVKLTHAHDDDSPKKEGNGWQ